MNEVAPIHTAHKDKFRHRHFMLLLIPSIVFVLALVFLFKRETPLQAPYSSLVQTHIETKTVSIGETKVNATVARTTAEHARGLSGVKSLGSTDGMLFVFPGKVRPAFWMKDMLIPLDFIWINDGKVTQIDKDVAFPESGTPDSKLKLYVPDDLVDYVLEVNAGFTTQNNVKVGDLVVLQ